MKLKVNKIVIELTDAEDGKVVSTMERNENYIWSINGPVYPKHMKLMSSLNDYMREIDVDCREKHK